MKRRVINYLKATNIEVGLLLNSGENRNLKDLYLIIKEKISVMISVNLWLNNYKYFTKKAAKG